MRFEVIAPARRACRVLDTCRRKTDGRTMHRQRHTLRGNASIAHSARRSLSYSHRRITPSKSAEIASPSAESRLNQYFFTDYDIVHMRSRVRSPGKGNPNHRTASP
jgi:hypothetical protein